MKDDYTRVGEECIRAESKEPYQKAPSILIIQDISPAIAGTRETALMVCSAFLPFVATCIARGRFEV